MRSSRPPVGRGYLLGLSFVCALAPGGNAHPQSGEPTPTLSDPWPAAIGPRVTSHVPRRVATNQWHSVAVKGDGTVYAWGDNHSFQLGLGDTVRRSRPTQLKELSSVVEVASGKLHGLALQKNGDVWAWGSGGWGALGIPFGYRARPQRCDSLSGVTQVAAGSEFSLFLMGDKTLRSCGYNEHGRLGQGRGVTWTYTPSPVLGLTDVRQVDASYQHGVTVLEGGYVYTWGWNYDGQLGLGDTKDRYVPERVPGLDRVTEVAAGTFHTLALRDGRVWAWGNNSSGQLGTGNTTDHRKPTRVEGVDHVLHIAAGWEHSLAIRVDGALFAWGLNARGELGVGTQARHPSPVQVHHLPHVLAVDAGREHTLALQDGEHFWAWGDNYYGQLGIASLGGHRALPTRVHWP